MVINHISALLIRLQPLPFERRTPVPEEAARPALLLVTPELAKGLLEQVGGVQPLVGSEQGPQCLSALQRKVLPARQQRVLLALDEATLFPGHACILALAHLIEGVAQVANDMELVEQDGSLWCMSNGSVAKRLPHVHHGEPYAPALLVAKLLITLGHTRFRAIVGAEPGRPSANEVADHDPIRVTIADGDFVDTDHGRPRRFRLGQLGAHVLLVQILHRMPAELELLRDIPDRSTVTASA
jgi:hypothetical protein